MQDRDQMANDQKVSNKNLESSSWLRQQCAKAGSRERGLRRMTAVHLVIYFGCHNSNWFRPQKQGPPFRIGTVGCLSFFSIGEPE